MASILQATSGSRDLKATRYPTPADNGGGGGGGYPADFQLLVNTAAGRGRQGRASTLDGGDDDVPSRGVRLLLKAKAFHVAVRGLQETPGFRFISRQPKRQESTAVRVLVVREHVWYENVRISGV